MMLRVRLLDPVIPRLDMRCLVYLDVTEVTVRDKKLTIKQDHGAGGGEYGSVAADLITAIPGTVFYRSQGLDFQTLKIEAQ